MSKLVEKYQGSCIGLKNIMKTTITNQVDASGRISYHDPKPIANIYNTDCNEFQNFVKKVNSNSDNNITIKVNSKRCDFIKTDVDLANKSVTYTLY